MEPRKELSHQIPSIQWGYSGEIHYGKQHDVGQYMQILQMKINMLGTLNMWGIFVILCHLVTNCPTHSS